MARLIFEGILTLIPNCDAYATQAIYGVITGMELYGVRNNPDKLKELILEKLKLAYEEGVNQVEKAKIEEKD